MYNFLLIDDSAEDRNSFSGTIKRLNLEAGKDLYKLDVAATYEEGLGKVSGTLNGIIVDIKLDGEHSGNELLHIIVEKFRVPVVVFTGTPDTDLPENSPIQIFKKGEALHVDILKELCAVSDTEMFNVLGGTGIIEQVMTQIFWKNLYPQINIWKEKKGQGIETEKVLLRYAVSHIQELIDDEVPAYVTEEMYISPPINDAIKTCSIIKEKATGLYCIVLSPPCDLAIHGGKMKTDRILVCEIDPQDKINAEITKDITHIDKKEKQIAKALNNNYADYYHWLPQNSLFPGGYINFRKVITYSYEELICKFEHPLIKVQEGFVKSILGRFSAYYARQGQPDFDFESEAKAIVSSISTLTAKA